MKKLWSCANKEWKLLWRDKIGLLVLFVLPMCLVMFVTYAEYRQLSGDIQFNLIIFSKNHSIIKAFQNNRHLKTTNSFTNINKAREEVDNDDYQALLVVPKEPTKTAQLHLSPNMAPSLSKTLILSIRYIFQCAAYAGLRRGILENSDVSPDKIPKAIFPVSIYQTVQANSVQQNVPAWSLFAMFFILIPLAGTMVHERQSGINQRLVVAPVSRLAMLSGKLIPFCIINMIQLILMLAVGVYILPLLGLPALELYPYISRVLFVGLAASCAAIGFGFLIGSWVRTYQQAVIMSPLIIMILAAIGGIFVPPYLMPKGLIQLGQFISPMCWAQTAFLDVFVRNANYHELLPNITKLLGFFSLTLLLSLLPVRRV